MPPRKGKGSRDESYRLGRAESALVGHTVEMILVQQKRTQKWLADSLHLSSTEVSDLINGRRNWDRSMVANVASVLETRESDILPPALRGLANFAAWGRAAKQLAEIAELLVPIEEEAMRDRAVDAVRKELAAKPSKRGATRT